LHEVDSDGDGVLDTSKLTEYLNDPLNITGYSQVLKQTETDLKTGESTTISYIIGLSKIAQITVKNGSKEELYFTFDGHGSTRVLTDLAGAIVELYSYDAFGNAIGFDPATAKTEYLYSGEQFDPKIGQQYLRQRYYDPTTGRFNRLDPFFGNLGDPKSFHKYLYTHADPVNHYDPSGQFAALIGIGISSLIGGLNQSRGAATNIYAANRVINTIQTFTDVFKSVHFLYAGTVTALGFLFGFGENSLNLNLLAGSYTHKLPYGTTVKITSPTIVISPMSQYPLRAPFEVNVEIDCSEILGKYRKYMADAKPIVSITGQICVFQTMLGRGIESANLSIDSLLRWSISSWTEEDGSTNKIYANLGLRGKIDVQHMNSASALWNNFEIGVFGAINALNENDVLREVSTLDFSGGALSYYMGIKPSDIATAVYAVVNGY
jgi:RHS repeat-associated protein